MKPYCAQEFSPGRWKIITPSGGTLYNDDDEQAIFSDEDTAYECACRLTAIDEEEIPEP